MCIRDRADRSLFLQELLVLAETAADHGLLRENPQWDVPEVTSPPVVTSNSVVKATTNSDSVVNCSAKASYLRAKNSGAFVRSGVGNTQRNATSRDVPGAKR